MKKKPVLIALASLAILLAGCEKEADNAAPEDKWGGWNSARYLTGFTMQAEEAATKAAIDFTSGAITWNGGDEVLVFVPATGATALYSYNGSYFEPEDEPLEVGTDEAYAYYPADAYSVEAGKVSLTMPESVTADPGNKLPMGGLIPAGGIPSGKERREGVFKSLGSIIWLKLTAVEGKEETLSSVVMENTSLALTGKAEVSWSAATPSLAALDGGKTIEVVCNKTLSTTTPAEFFLFAPAGSMEGLSITVNFEEEAAHFKPFAKITRNSTLALERNKVLPIAWNVNGFNGGISAKGDPIRVEDGKVLFFVEIPAGGSAVRNALGYDGSSFSGYSVFVNGTEYEVLTNKGGETYIEVDEAADGKYEAYMVKGESLGLYGATPAQDVVMPFSQFYAGTKADFENYPRYAGYTEATGNVLAFKDAIALVDLKLAGSVKLASVKLRAIGGETLSGRADYSYSAGAFVPEESLPEAVVNCTNQGSFVQLDGSTRIPVLIAPGTYSAGLELTAVTADHLVMRKTLTPGEIAAGTVYSPELTWTADENVLFFEGFDNFVWGGNIMAGSSGFGYAPDASSIGTTGGRTRDGYARAYTKVAYNVAGTGYMQSDTWNDVKDATVATSHVLTDSYFTSRNLNDWIILYRGQEYQGVLSLGTAETKRGVMKTPFFKNVQGTCDVKFSFDVCLQTGNTKGIQFQIHNGGHFESCTIDGAATATKSYQYKATYSEPVFNNNVIVPASSAAAAKTWHRVEVTILGATDATTVDFRSVTASGATVGMWVDNVTVEKVPGTEKKGNLRILYWNIQNGMWWDQGNNFDNFVAFVNKYDPDICIWCEAESNYQTGTDTWINDYDSKPLRAGNWAALASRYGHIRAARSGRTDTYPQEVTAKYAITRAQELTTNLTHGGGHFQITVNGTRLNIVTTHPYPHDSGASNHTTTAQINADNTRLAEMTYLLNQTVNNSAYASEDNWIVVGDMNANSPLDSWYTGIDATNSAVSSQKYLLEHTDLKDVMYEFWNGGGADTFCNTTTGAKDRRDFIYLSPSLMNKTRRAIMLNDSWTYKIEVIQLSEQSFKSPSDHRPILVDIQL